MDIQKVSWQNYRNSLFPTIKQVETRNNHQFSDEIDQALSSDGAFLFVGEDGFFVLQPLSENSVVTVNVMFAFNWGGNAIERYQNMIEQFSREIGATGLELYTVVKSLVPLLEQQDWQLTNGDRVMHFIKQL